MLDRLDHWLTWLCLPVKKATVLLNTCSEALMSAIRDAAVWLWAVIWAKARWQDSNAAVMVVLARIRWVWVVSGLMGVSGPPVGVVEVGTVVVVGVVDEEFRDLPTAFVNETTRSLNVEYSSFRDEISVEEVPRMDEVFAISTLNWINGYGIIKPTLNLYKSFYLSNLPCIIIVNVLNKICL